MSSPDQDDSPIILVFLPPERDRTRSSVPVCAGPCCCCCCCCCLHSVGGILGAIAFSGRASHDRRTDDSLEEESEELFPSANGSSLSPTEGGRRNESSAVSTFWLTLLL